MNSSITFNGSVQVHYATDCSVSPQSWPKSLLHASLDSLHNHVEYILSLSARGRLRLVRRGGTGSRTCLYHICMVLQQPARNNQQQRACPLDSKTLRQPQAFLFQPLPLSLFNRLCCALVSGTPAFRVRAFDVTAFLVYPAQAATS